MSHYKTPCLLRGCKKKHGGIRQAYDQSQVSTGTAGRIGSLFWVGEHTGARPVDLHWSFTWVVRLTGTSIGSDRRSTCIPLTGTRPTFFHCYFFAGSVGGRPIRGHWWRRLAGIMGTIIGSAMSRSGNHLKFLAN